MRIIIISACIFVMNIISISMCKALRAEPGIPEASESVSCSLLECGDRGPCPRPLSFHK